MKIQYVMSLMLAVACAAASGGANAAEQQSLQGSDTLAGVMTDAIIAAGMSNELVYTGGGSGKGEAAILQGLQGVAPMSRAATDKAIAEANGKGYAMVPHVLGLDGVGIFVNAKNGQEKIDFASLVSIFKCQVTTWDKVPGSKQTGEIHAFRRNDSSGTTDTFKSLVGVDAFGPCVKVVAETADIANNTSTDAQAIGYAGLSGKRDGNKILMVAGKTGAQAFAPTVANIRSFAYPLSRKLYMYSTSGARTPNAVEAKFLGYVTDRSFLDPILQNNEFFTLD